MLLYTSIEITEIFLLHDIKRTEQGTLCMSQTNNKRLSIKEWVHFISNEDMPVFSHTARKIASASNDVDTSITDLAHLILQDSAMTARVLRLANSVYYNPSGQEVSTISRAIVYLGFDVVRSMALTIAIIDPMLTGLKQEHVLQEMARSFHAAIQAKSIAEKRGIDDIEEVFIAALLFRLGNMAFWCFPKSFAAELDQSYKDWDGEALAENEVLGFPLAHLTAALNNEWHLSKLLYIALQHQENDSGNEQAKDLEQAYELILAVEEGWGDLRVNESIVSIADRIELSHDETEEMIKKNAHEAARMAGEYGAEAASKLIPLPNLDEELLKIEEREYNADVPDMQLQMTLLRELTTMLHEHDNLNGILSTVIEGIYRGLGMERTILAFTSADSILQAKYVLGDDSGKFKNCFSFPIGNKENDLFSFMLNSKDALWLNQDSRSKYSSIITNNMKKCLGTLDFFAMPIWVGGKGKGLIYADRKKTGTELTSEQFQTFTHFSEYATIAFDLMSKQK